MKKDPAYSYRLALRTALVDARVLPSGDEVTRFAVLGTWRTGSNLVMTSIGQHPEALTFGELFVDRDRVLSAPYPAYPWTLTLRNRFPVRFLERKVFRRLPVNVRAVGFKIFYHQCDWEPATRIWPFLQQQEEMRVIHLKRRNLLRTQLSRQKAVLTWQWTQRDDEDRDEVSVRLDPDECEQAFAEVRESERRFDAMFGAHPTMELVYEELAADHTGQINRVWEFLELEPIAMPPVLAKQGRMPLRRAIENFAELKERFSGTPWEEFFDE